MHGVWTVAEIQDAERRLFRHADEAAVMRRAAFAVSVRAAELLAEHRGGVAGARVALLVGSGNNGGDALWAGAYLLRRGAGVTAVLLKPERVHPAGLAAFRRSGGRVCPGDGSGAAAAVSGADLVVDGIVGLSAHGGLREPAATLAGHVTAPVLSVDLPSGVEPDTGAVPGAAITAHSTVTFGGRKPCHVLGEGAVRSGNVRVADIGLDLPEPGVQLLTAREVGALWPVPQFDSDKYTQGVAGIAAGSARYPGAGVLATGGAVRAKSGMVRFAGSAADAVRGQWPEVVAGGSVADAGRVQSWVVGPGLGMGEAARDILREVLGAGVPVCADADAITVLGQHGEVLDARQPGTPLVLTPHAGEFARLAGEVGEDRVASVRDAARRYGAVVLLKGYTTVIAAPDGRVLVNPARDAWAATAGSGDVLSGIIGALLAAGLEPLLAAGAGAYVHTGAARLAASGAPAPASDLVAAIPDALRALRVPRGK